ncbi:MAG TPA: hypothetical protein VD969_06485 [Symbiobacteriaceae bacterium]|nr:hypothetical protein [Symbiobacteriaceae bacterium]
MESWVSLLAADPKPWLLASDEPAARWITLTQLLGRSADDPQVVGARAAVLEDPLTRELIGRLPDWEVDNEVSGHSSPKFAPNLLNLLADMGLQGGDDPRVDAVLQQMLRHQDAAGRFAAYSRSGHGNTGRLPEPVWGTTLCDTHAITDVLVRFGLGADERTRSALRCMAEDRIATAQGEAWPCIPHSVTGFRGPGRKADFCPMVTVEALRAFAWLPDSVRPPGLHASARTALRAWRVRSEEKPYMMGHGYQFKVIKWPAFWYNIFWMLDTLGRYPELWSEPGAAPEDRQALAEMCACLIAYNFNGDGQVVPQSCYKGFEAFSFGQKKQPSPFATATLAAVLARFDALTEEIRAVDIRRLGSSKGGTGVPLPPRA